MVHAHHAAPDTPDLLPLYENCMFKSDLGRESHDLVAEELSDHNLKWGAGRIDTRLYKITTQRLSLFSLRYGAEVEIFPKVYRDFSLVHYAKSSDIEITVDGVTSRIKQGQAVLCSPRDSLRMRWSECSEQLILKLPNGLLNAADETAEGSQAKSRPITPLTLGAQKVWLPLLASIVQAQRFTSDPKLALWMRHLEDNVCLLLNAQRGATTDEQTAGGPENLRDLNTKKRRDRLERYVLDNIDQPIKSSDLAQAAALSERQFNSFCHAQFGMSPMAWLRAVRLDAVRRDIVDNPVQDITQVAYQYGFFHPGRFSGAYRARFGELPSETRNCAKSG